MRTIKKNGMPKNKSSYSQFDESHSVAQYLLYNSNELFSTFEM